MWLLSTDRAELRFFESPESVPGGYAILSHVWGPDEQSFQDIQALRSQIWRNPRSRTSAKIKQCCKLAEAHGYKWVWIDTCCIDKTSSAELSEAINSMFRYYSLAGVCYAYLFDVPNYDYVHSWGSSFRRSRWHQRGWTLQELLAPELVVFLSRDWRVLGTKAELAELVEEITKIPASVLKLEEGLENISVARRMSWAAERRTTRVEDEAYCLMGIFSINMPTLYGEGRNAFRRLQEEIMKSSIDMSLFAWDFCYHERSLNPTADPDYHGVPVSHPGQSYLFAPSPGAFRWSKDVSFVPEWNALQPAHDSLPSTKLWQYLLSLATNRQSLQSNITPAFTITPNGIQSRVPIIEDSGYTIVVLFCTNKDKKILGLLLTPLPSSSDRPVYSTGICITRSSIAYSMRITTLGDKFEDLLFAGNSVTARWKDIYIVHQPSQTASAGPHRHPFVMNGRMTTPFRFPKQEVEKLQIEGFRLVLGTDESSSSEDLHTRPLVMTFNYEGTERRRCTLVLRLGLCRAYEIVRPHWASVHLYNSNEAPLDDFTHSCPEDHISRWPNQARGFEIPINRSFGAVNEHYDNWTLSFKPCLLNPSKTLIVHISHTMSDYYGESSVFTECVNEFGLWALRVLEANEWAVPLPERHKGDSERT